MRQMKNSGIEWIGEIPADWELKRIKAIFLERKEKNDPVQTDFILSLGASYGVVPYSEKEGGGNKAKEDLTDYRVAYPNDIVMNSMNIISGSVGLSRYFGCVSPVYYILYPRQDNVDPNFYCLLFQTKAFQRSLLGLGNGILIKESSNGNFNTVRMRIPMEKLGVQLLPVPTLDEQKKIADFLDRTCSEIDAVIAKTKATIEEYKALKQSIITEAVTKGIRGERPMKESGIEWIGEIPAEWDVVRIKTLFDYRNERNDKPLEEVNLISLYTDLGVVQHCDLEATTGNKASNADGYKLVYEDDIVVNIILCWMGAIGRSAYTGVTSPAYDVYSPKEGTNTKFYHHLFRTQGFNGDCYKVGRGIMAMRWRTYSDQFRAIKVVAPPQEEQQVIVDYLDKKCAEIDTLIAKKSALLEEMENYKKSVIYEYVTGKKEVK